MLFLKITDFRPETDLAIIGALLYLILGKAGNGPQSSLQLSAGHHSTVDRRSKILSLYMVIYQESPKERTLAEKFQSDTRPQ